VSAATAVTVVVPNLDGAGLLEAHLPPLLEELAGRADSEVIVADAASEDGSLQVLARRFGKNVRVLPSPARLSFAANCNRAVACARHDRVLCLNSDVAVEPGFLDPLLTALDEPRTFAASPAILRRGDGPGRWFNESVHRSFRSFGLTYHSRVRDDEIPRSGGPYAISYACGAAIAFRKPLFQSLGGFDVLFDPFYWEDFDLCYRAWRRGWRTVYVTGSVVRHDHRGTIGRLYREEEVDTVIERNRFLFSWKSVTDPMITASSLFWTPAKLAEAALGRRPAVGRGFKAARPLFSRAWSRREFERREACRGDRETFRIFAASYRGLAREARRERTENGRVSR